MSSCPEELELSMYADGALDAAAATRLHAHLESCRTCRDCVGALTRERALIRAALDENEQSIEIPALPALTAGSGGGLPAAALVIALASSSLLLTDLLPGLRLPPSLAWLNPFTPSAIVNLIVRLCIFILLEGKTMLTSMFVPVATVTCLAMLAGAAVVLSKRLGRGTALLTVALAVAAAGISGESDALEIRRSEGVLTVPAGETIDDTLLAFGDTIEIDGTVTGDLIAMGRQVVIRGIVQGQVLAAARSVHIDGSVEGTVLGFAETLAIRRGDIARNLFGFGRIIEAQDSATVNGNAVLFGSEANIDSSVGQDVVGFAGALQVGSDVGGDVNAHAGTLRVLSQARIGGDLIAHIREESALQLSPDAVVMGEVRTEIDPDAPGAKPGAGKSVGAFLSVQVLRFGAAFVTGLLLLWLVPPLKRLSLDSLGETVTAAGAGLIAIIAVPIIALMIAFTLIGLPIAVVGVLLWLVALYFAKIVLAHFVGRRLFDRAGRSTHFATALAVGLVLILLAVNMPWVGGLVNFLLTITGFGLLVMFLWGQTQGRPVAA